MKNNSFLMSKRIDGGLKVAYSVESHFNLTPKMAEEFLSDVPPPVSLPARTREPLRHVLYGSKLAIARTISILHIKGYAETFEWSKPIPTQTPGEYISILSHLMQIE